MSKFLLQDANKQAVRIQQVKQKVENNKIEITYFMFFDLVYFPIDADNFKWIAEKCKLICRNIDKDETGIIRMYIVKNFNHIKFKIMTKNKTNFMQVSYYYVDLALNKIIHNEHMKNTDGMDTVAEGENVYLGRREYIIKNIFKIEYFDLIILFINMEETQTIYES